MTEKNVVIFGESGAGKSSTVNLLLGREVAIISDGAVGCTFQYQKYPAGSYNLFDTVGLEEGTKGTMSSQNAINHLVNLLKSLESGVSLLIFVIEKGRIKQSLDKNYKLFVDAICQKKVPVLLVITHCEMETERGQWWRENKHHFYSHGMTFKEVISGCCMNPDKAPPIMNKDLIRSLNNATVSHLRQAIEVNMLKEGWKVKGGWMKWLVVILKSAIVVMSSLLGPIGTIGGLLFGAAIGNGSTIQLEQRIKRYYIQQGYDPAEAKRLAEQIAKGIDK